MGIDEFYLIILYLYKLIIYVIFYVNGFLVRID